MPLGCFLDCRSLLRGDPNVASIIRESGGKKTIQFSAGELAGRPKVRLGKASESVATSVRVKLEALAASKKAGLNVDAETATWLGKISDNLHQRLAGLGLAETRDAALNTTTLGGLNETYISSRSSLAENTQRNYRNTQRMLEQHFGKTCPLASITAGHARDYKEWLIGRRFAPATISREIKRAKQFFEYAVDCKMIQENPFRKIKAGAQTNSDRKVYIPEETVDVVLKNCTDNEFRLIVALSRYGGLRIPSELTHLTWNDVDWANNSITVYSPKKKGIDSQKRRRIPIFPEIRPFLEKAILDAPEGSTHVISENSRRKKANLRTKLLRILKRAGVKKWEKLFQNLRASRETDLMLEWPAHIVCSWLGNSIQVANDHYLMVTAADFETAAGAKPPESRNADAVQNPVQPATVRSRQTSSTKRWKTENPANARYTADQAPPRGVEPRFSD